MGSAPGGAEPPDFRDGGVAIAENGAELLLALGRSAGTELRDDGRESWTIGNCPIDYHNAVVRADLSPEEADEVIEASLERMRAHGIPRLLARRALDAPSGPRRAARGAWLRVRRRHRDGGRPLGAARGGPGA